MAMSSMLSKSVLSGVPLQQAARPTAQRPAARVVVRAADRPLFVPGAEPPSYLDGSLAGEASAAWRWSLHAACVCPDANAFRQLSGGEVLSLCQIVHLQVTTGKSNGKPLVDQCLLAVLGCTQRATAQGVACTICICTAGFWRCNEAQNTFVDMQVGPSRPGCRRDSTPLVRSLLLPRAEITTCWADGQWISCLEHDLDCTLLLEWCSCTTFACGSPGEPSLQDRSH